MVVIAAAAFSMGARPTGASDSSQMEAGHVLYMRYCSSCHGPNADGHGPVAKLLETPSSDLRRLGDRYGLRCPPRRLPALLMGARKLQRMAIAICRCGGSASTTFRMRARRASGPWLSASRRSSPISNRFSSLDDLAEVAAESRRAPKEKYCAEARHHPERKQQVAKCRAAQKYSERDLVEPSELRQHRWSANQPGRASAR